MLGADFGSTLPRARVNKGLRKGWLHTPPIGDAHDVDAASSQSRRSGDAHQLALVGAMKRLAYGVLFPSSRVLGRQVSEFCAHLPQSSC
jgi:hypothetical protein